MKLYVWYGTLRKAGPRTQPCNFTPGRREVKRLTGNYWVPVIVGDDGTVVQGSKRIAEWAQVHPAHVGGKVGIGAT